MAEARPFREVSIDAALPAIRQIFCSRVPGGVVRQPVCDVFTYPGIGNSSWAYSKLVSLRRPLFIHYLCPTRRARSGVKDLSLRQASTLIDRLKSGSPGFSGKVEDFRMLISFPTPPALRKVSEDIFPQIAKAIDPPEVVVDLRRRLREPVGRRSNRFDDDAKKDGGAG